MVVQGRPYYWMYDMPITVTDVMYLTVLLCQKDLFQATIMTKRNKT